MVAQSFVDFGSLTSIDFREPFERALGLLSVFSPQTWAMIAVGTLVAFYLTRRNRG